MSGVSEVVGERVALVTALRAKPRLSYAFLLPLPIDLVCVASSSLLRRGDLLPLVRVLLVI